MSWSASRKWPSSARTRPKSLNGILVGAGSPRRTRAASGGEEKEVCLAGAGRVEGLVGSSPVGFGKVASQEAVAGRQVAGKAAGSSTLGMVDGVVIRVRIPVAVHPQQGAELSCCEFRSGTARMAYMSIHYHFSLAEADTTSPHCIGWMEMGPRRCGRGRLQGRRPVPQIIHAQNDACNHRGVPSARVQNGKYFSKLHRRQNVFKQQLAHEKTHLLHGHVNHPAGGRVRYKVRPPKAPDPSP